MKLSNKLFYTFRLAQYDRLLSLPIAIGTKPVEDCGRAWSALKNLVFLVVFLVTFQFATAQTSVYHIQLKDKQKSAYSIDAPSEYLSPKAIERRLKQNIPLSTTDLPVSEAYVNEIRATGVKITNRSKWFNSIVITCSDTNKINAITSLRYVIGIKKIETATANKRPSKFETTGTTIIQTTERDNNSQTPTPASLNYGYAYNQAHQLNADCLHDMGYKGQGMTIAVLDAGFFDVNILPAFDSLRLNNHLLGTRDFVTGDTMVFEDFAHGMNVLSCMAANIPGLIVGTAPMADYWLLRTEDASSESMIEEFNWLTAAEFADSVGADIINSSLGYNYFDNSADDHTYADMDGNTTIITKAADMAASKGIMVVTSAGNYGAGPWYKITAPADADSVLTVGAIDSAGVIAALSSSGPTYDGRIKPNTVARGLNAVVAGNTGGVMYASGTSFSSPITAGAVACLWQANPAATNMELLNVIEQSANLHTSPDTIMGYGIPDFCLARTILTGIEQQSLTKDKLTVYPNPFENELNISFYSTTKQTITISLHDILGRELYKLEKIVNINENEFFSLTDIPKLSKGIYLLSITVSEKKYTKRLIKK